MKKLILSLIAVAVGTLGSFAQDDLVATLSHGSNLSTFTGEDALQQAYNAAAEGDVITLSPGVFTGVTVEKAITIRGAGMMPMNTNGYVATQIAGDMPINVPASSSSVITIEGIQVLGSVDIKGDKLAKIKLLKSRFNSSVIGLGISMNANSCIFASSLTADHNGYKNTTLNCMNCVINDAVSDGYIQSGSSIAIAKIIATNCLVNIGYNSVPYSIFVNSILTDNDFYGSNCPLPETCSATNCIGINWRSTPNLFQNLIDTSNVMVEGSGATAYANVFKTLRSMGSLPINENYKLTDESAAKYLGDDGTQVGIYGGSYPFNPVPTNPKLKKFTVNSNANNGKLNVKINVE